MPIQIGRRPDHTTAQPLGLLSDCHRRIEHFLEVLTTFADRVEGGVLTPGQRGELDAALTYFATAAPKHTADEEESLFPRLRATGDPRAAHTLEIIDRLERDHHEADRHHAAVHALGRQWLTAGTLEAADVDALGGHLAALRTIYDEHIGIEDRELFPAAARLLSSDQLIEVGREMAARRNPASSGPVTHAS